MKKSIRILAAILLLSTLFCTLSVSISAMQPYETGSDFSDTESEDIHADHEHDNESGHQSPTPSEPLQNPGNITLENDENTGGNGADGEDEEVSDIPQQAPDTVIGTGVSGDVNGDGTVNNIDAILLHRFVSGEDVAVDTDALDVNGDGLVSYDDSIMLFRYISGWTDSDIGYGYGWALGCAHSLVLIPAISATCENDGNVEHFLCEKCGVAFADENAETVISDADIVISAYSQHTFTQWSIISQPSCTHKGIQQRGCESCDYSETVEADMLSHNVELYQTDREPTCTDSGEKSGVCLVCQNRITLEISATGHEPGDPIDNENETCLDRTVGTVRCTKCDEILSSYGHDYVTTTVAATCTADGSVTKECSRCHSIETTVILHVGHIEGFPVTLTEATCTEAGEMALGCLYCDYIFTETKYEISALGHNYTLSEAEELYIFTCELCSHSYTEAKESVSVHKITFVSTHGDGLCDLYVEDGAEIKLPFPSADGFVFYGWFKDSAYEEIFEDKYIDANITLYAKWEPQEIIPEEDVFLSDMPEDFSFTIKTDELTDSTSIDDLIIVIDENNNAIELEFEEIGDGIYKITPADVYEKGELYKVILRDGAEFENRDGNEMWFTVEKENSNIVTLRPGVIRINDADIFAITEGENGYWYVMLYDDALDVDNYFVIYDGEESNIIHSCKVYEEGSFDRYYVYRIDELKSDEISEVFDNIDIHYNGEATLGDFVPDENMLNAVEEEFLNSELYKQIQRASAAFVNLSSDGRYFYDHHYPVVSINHSHDDSKITFTITVDVTFGRLNTLSGEVEDLYTITFKIKNETNFLVVADAESIDRYEFKVTPVNKTTVGLYAKAGGKIVNDARLDYFKEVFIKAKDDGETDALNNAIAHHKDTKPIAIIPLFAVPGVSISVELYNVFTFEAMGEIGFEVVTQIEPTIGVVNYGSGARIVKDFRYYMSVKAYAHAKMRVSDRLGAKLKLSLIGMVHVSAGIEVGPYAEAGGLLNIIVEWGTNKPVNFGATAGGYVEVGVDVDAYVSLEITTFVLKIQLYEHTWILFDKNYVLFSLGNKEMPLKFETIDEPIEKTADLLYQINIADSISKNVLYQNLQTMKTFTKSVKVSYSLVNNPDFASITSNGRLTLNENVGDRTYVDLQIKVSFLTLFKIINVRIYIEHDYEDEFTCHDRVCLYCGYLCRATTPHVYSDFEVVSSGVCSPNPYSMRICFDCRATDFTGINPDEAQHHDYQLIPEETLEPTCTEDGYLTYRCVRTGCQSENRIAVLKSHGSHDFIRIDGGDVHYLHCQRVGCGYNSESENHIARSEVGCTENSVCIFCGHVMEYAPGHNFELVTSKAATCTEPGYYSYLECTECHEKDSFTEIPMLNHSYTLEWIWNGFESVQVIASCANGHNESYTVKTLSAVTRAPTCTAFGEKTYVATLFLDGRYYSDTKTETLPPVDHNIQQVAQKEATCTSVGWDAYEFCTRCSHTTKILRDMLPHTGGTATCASRARCAVCNSEYGSLLSHRYSTHYVGDESGHYHVCSCGSIDTVLEHNPDKTEPTETEDVICVVCAYVIAPKTGHINHNYTVLVYNGTHHWYQCDSCSETDIKIRHFGGETSSCTERSTCQECGTVYGDYGPHNDTACTNSDMHWYVCSECYRVTNKERHRGGKATCTEKAKCIDCEVSYGELKEHNFDSRWCYDSENHYRMCSCGEIKDSENHIPNRTAPTETESVRCTVCAFVIVPATGHINHNYSVLQHDETSHWYKCSDCDATINEMPHNGGTTTCREQAVCAVCEASYGDMPEHVFVQKTNAVSHWYECEFCGTTDLVGNHTGGYSTCITKAVCSVCEKEYGSLRQHSYQYAYDDLNHWKVCRACKITCELSVHTGGTATCKDQADCSVCGKEYGDLLPHTPSPDDGDCTTDITCSVCGTVTESGNSSHTGGSATCTEKAKCSLCGKEYGELADHTPEPDDGDCTTDVICSVCGAVTDSGNYTHMGGTATCKDKAMCAVCGKEYGALANHTPEPDDGDCTTEILCSLCDTVTTEAKAHSFYNACDTTCNNQGCRFTRTIQHIPSPDDGNCETPITCSICTRVTTEAMEHSFDNSCDTECNNPGCTFVRAILHTPNPDDGDCTTEITCSVCSSVTTEAKLHRFDNACDPDCNNPGCNRTRVTVHAPNSDDGDCTTALACSVCDAILTPAKPSHTGGTATCAKLAECEVCGKEYGVLKSHTPAADDGDCTTALLCTECGSVTVAAKSHNFLNSAQYEYNDTHHFRICTNTGCSVSNQAYPEAHLYGEWYIPYHDSSIHAKSCICGKTVWESHAPLADDNDCTTAVLCSVCSLTAIKANAHVFDTLYGNDADAHWQICQNDGCSVINRRNNHIYGEYSIDESDSSKHIHTCTVCNYSESLAHNFVSGAYVYDDSMHWKRCKDCDAEDRINAQAHSGTPANCTQKAKCSTCNAEYGEIDPYNHNYVFIYDDFAHYDECSRCHKIKNSYAHSIDYRVDVTENTATNDYLHAYTEFCTGCGYSKVLSTENIHMHENAEAYGGVPATCENSGYLAGLRCTECNHIYFEPSVIPARGHEILPDGTVEAKEPTCTRDGNVEYEVCRWCACAIDTDCNRIENTIVPKINHLLKRTSDGSVIEIDVSEIHNLSSYPELVMGCIGVPPSDETEGRSSFVCESCGGTVFVKVIGHYFESKHDDANHWLYCTVAGCGKIKDSEEHKFSQNTCTVCGFRVSSGLAYTLSADKTSYTVSGIGNCSDTNVVIPKTYNNLPVTAIATYAFKNCTGMTGITIPNTITSIGAWAFTGCTSLTRVDITDLSVWCKMPFSQGSTNPLEYAHNLYLNGELLTDLVIPEDVTEILYHAFSGCSSLRSITIHENVNSIENNSFMGCNELDSITVAEGNQSFSGNGNCLIKKSTGSLLLGCKNSVIPSDGSVKIIDYFAFYNCASLSSIIIPEGVTTLGWLAFSGCTGLTAIDIPSSVTRVGGTTFDGCTNLIKTVDGIKYVDDWIVGCTNSYAVSGALTIPDGIRGLASTAFFNCSALTSVTIPKSVITIGSQAFDSCSSLTSVIFEENSSLRIIDYSAFSQCTALASIDIPDSVITVGGSAFYNCTKLIETENGIIYADSWVIGYEGTPTDVVLRDGTKGVATYAFQSCSSLTSITLPDSVISVDNYAIQSCSNLISVINGKNLINIGDYAFYNCAKLETVPIGNYVVIIGNSAFAYCRMFTEIIIPDCTTTIGNYAFTSCARLTSVTIGNGVTYIGYQAFESCYNLVTVTLGSSVEKIDDYAFSYCNKIADVYYARTEGDFARISIGSNNEYLTGATIHFTDEVYSEGLEFTLNGDGESYTVSGIGSASDSHIIIPAYYENKPVTAIGDCAFSSALDMTGITIGRNVTSIGEQAFAGTYLDSINIPDNVIYIGNYAFTDCQSLSTARLGKGVNYIGNYAFYSCVSLSEVTIQGNAARIGDYAFDGCQIRWLELGSGVLSIGNFAFRSAQIQNLELPDTLTSIGDNAFSSCDQLNSVTFSDSIKTIGNYAFSGCWLLEYITLGNGVTSIGEFAFSYSGLKSIIIPNSVTTIKPNAFLRSIPVVIYCEAESQPSGWTSNWNSEGSPVVWNYKNNDVADDGYIYTIVDGIRYALKDGVAKVVRQSFASPFLVSATISSSVIYNGIDYCVTAIDDYAFSSCSNLGDILIPDSVTTIGNYAFNWCSNLEYITLGKNIASIGNYAFKNCSSIDSVYYAGSEEDFANISIGLDNEDFANATLYYNCEMP